MTGLKTSKRKRPAKRKFASKAEYDADYYARNRDDILARQSAYNEANRADINAKQLARRNADPELFNQRNRDWRAGKLKQKGGRA